MGLLAGSALFGYVDGVQLRAGGEAVHALLYVASLIAVVVAVYWAARRIWVPAAVALGAGAVVYAVYLVDRHRPAAVRDVRPAAGDAGGARRRRAAPADARAAGEEYRRGEGD